jgi:DNA topoisomerase VI subunit B
MPPIATEISPHPKSLNNITLGNLLKETKCQSVAKFLYRDLSGISPSLAAKITSNLDIADTAPSALTSSQVAALCQTLRDEKLIKPPAATCLSPAGEYNMRLGVLKELRPKLVATYTEKPGSCEGHPFLVEAAVSIGGTQVCTNDRAVLS